MIFAVSPLCSVSRFLLEQRGDMNHFATIPFALALVGCASEAEKVDRLPTSTAAIELAKKICEYRDMGPGWIWCARFRRGIWHVWLNAHYENDENSAASSVDIRASDGTSDGCPVVT
jgi:hypothetical protein